MEINTCELAPMLIGLTGYSGSGKDATAALLSMVGYSRVAFADSVRHEVESAIMTRSIPPEATVDAETSYNIARNLMTRECLSEVWDKPTVPRMRRVLQWWGTDYRRKQDSNYWIQPTMHRVAGLTVVSDVRFPNEVAAIRDRGGVIWRIVRDARGTLSGAPGHISESVMDTIQPDSTIYNNDTLIDLAKQVKSLIKVRDRC